MRQKDLGPEWISLFILCGTEVKQKEARPRKSRAAYDTCYARPRLRGLLSPVLLSSALAGRLSAGHEETGKVPCACDNKARGHEL